MKLVSLLYSLKQGFLDPHAIVFVRVDVPTSRSWFVYKDGREGNGNDLSTWQLHLDRGNIYPALPDYMLVAEGL